MSTHIFVLMSAPPPFPWLLSTLCLGCYASVAVLLFGWGEATSRVPPSPERDLALYWMKRVRTTDFTDWYNTNAETVGSSAGRTLPGGMGVEGQVLMPLHAVYLYALSRVVDWHPHVVWASAFGLDAQNIHAQQCHTSECFDVHHDAVVVLVVMMSILVPPILWALMARVAAMLVDGLNDRAAVNGPVTSTSSTSLSGVTRVDQSVWVFRCTAIGFGIVFLFAVLPLTALEFLTLHPVAMCGAGLLAVVYLMLTEEYWFVNRENYPRSSFDFSKPFYEQGHVCSFSLKRGPPLRGMAAMAALTMLLCLLLRSMWVIAPFVFVWIFTLCYQHAHRRLLVCVKVPEGEQSAKSARDGYIDFGYSCYRDRLYLQFCAGSVLSAAVVVAIIVGAPFVYKKQPLCAFVDLFAPPYTERLLPVGETARVSLTGGRELTEDCLTIFPRTFTCTRPSPNVWLLSEFYGVSWTQMSVSLAALVTSTKRKMYTNGYLWLDFVTLTILVLSNGVTILTALLYRVRRVPLTFESPAEFLAEYRAQEKIFDNYWTAEAERLSKTRLCPASERTQWGKPCGAETSGQNEAKIVRRTCITQEEYALKQLSIFLWIMLGAVATCNLFVLHAGGITNIALALVPAMVLRAVDAMISALRWALPEAFIVPSLAPEEETRTIRKGGCAVTVPNFRMSGLDLPSGSRWCSSANLSETSEVLWAIVVGAVVGICGETILTGSPALQQGRQNLLIALAALFAFYLLKRRCIGNMSVVSALLLIVVNAASLYAMYNTIDLVGGDMWSMLCAWGAALYESLTGPVDLTGGRTIDSMVYHAAVACVLLLGTGLQAAVRIARLALQQEEVCFVDPSWNSMSDPASAGADSDQVAPPR